jgi:release factor glutamine methyltransferase
MSQSFRLAGIDSPEADARLLLSAALHVSRTQLMSQSGRLLKEDEVSAIAQLAVRRIKREPVSRILGEKEFWSLPLRVSPDVLVPRPETETLVEAAIDETAMRGLRAEKLNILDIGTGSGALLLALLKECPNALGAATDISERAIAIARANAERHKLAARCVFVA